VILDTLLLLRPDSQIALVDDLAPKLAEPLADTCNPDGGRAHVDTPAAGTQIHRDSYDMDRHI
jgi:hypothetical protein